MTKLEQKLIQLGYSPLGYRCAKYDWYNGLIHISLNVDKTEIIDYFAKGVSMRNEFDLDMNIQAFNQLQKDLEVLKEYEENN